MKFWTVQRKEVVNAVIKSGGYQPNFLYSEYPKVIAELDGLYDFVLRSFNNVNNSKLPGLIFSYVQTDGKYIKEISSFEEFYRIIQENKTSNASLWNYLATDDNVVLELNYDQLSFNPLYININDFQFMMPPVITELPPYSETDVIRIYESISNGQPTPAPLHSDLIQAHLPFITTENIVNVYKTFKFVN